MAIDTQTEITIRKALTEIVESVPEAGYVIPAPRYCNSIQSYWAAADPTKVTREEIETEEINATWLYPVNFVDDFTSGGHDSPLISLQYEIYLFRQSGLVRGDETEMPDVFESKLLDQHNKFVAAWLGIKAAFQREANIDGLEAHIFVTRKTKPVTQVENIENLTACEFVPGVIGYAVRLIATVQLKFTEC